MTNVIKQNCLRRIRWIVTIPNSTVSLTSEPFLFQCLKCHFKLTSGIGYGSVYDPSDIYFHHDGELKLPLNILVRIADSSTTYITKSQTITSIGTGDICILNSSEGGLPRNTLLTIDVIICDSSTDDKAIQTASYMNADVSEESLPKDFSELLNTGWNSDVELKCGELSIKAHEIVLCTRSDVFRAMLQSDMREGQTGVIEIQDMDARYFQDFVRYLYTDIMPELTFDKAKALYEAGDKYNVRSLMLRCSAYFQGNLTVGNLFRCLTLADTHSDVKLKEKIITYILDEKIYLQREHWLPFYENYPKVALEVYKLSYEKDEN